MKGQARFLSSSFRAGAAISIFILGTTGAFAQKDDEAQPNLTTTPAALQSGVLLYKPFEIQLSTTTNYGNPYHDASLTGVFTSPSGQQMRLKGFWNGGRNWVVRFAPTEVGSWTYRTESSDGSLVTSGTFEAQANPAKRGFVRASPSRRYQFEYSDGTPFLLMGETNWDAMTGGVGFESRFKPFVNLRVSQNFNAFNTMVVQNRYDYQSNEGGPPYEMLNSNTRNYDRLNPGFFQWVDRRVAYADSMGMVSILFFTWAEELRQMPRDAYKRLALYIVSRYAAYNVFWVLAGDYSVYFDDPPLYREVGNAVAEADPYGHPISIHPGDGRSNLEFGNDGWLGYVMYQHRDAGEFLADSIRVARVYNKPVLNAEYGYHLPNHVHAHGLLHDAHYTRTGGWMIFNAGGYFVSGFQHTYYDPDEHYDDDLDTRWDLSEPQDLEAGRQHTVFYRFFHDHTSWWELDPHPDLARPGGPLDGQTELLAKPGSEYVAYNVRGGRMRLQLPANQYFSLAWFDPVAGTLQPGRVFQSTGEAVLLMPSSDSDAAALLRAAAPPSVTTDGGVTNLQSQQLNIRQARFSWQTPEPSDSRLDLQKPDGSRVQYLDNRETTQHEIIVDGLLPDINYTATVASQTADRREWKSSPVSLRTSVVVMDQWVEAESMPIKTVGHAEPPGWNLNADGHLAISLNFPQTGPYRFVVRSRSEHRDGWPNLALQVDNSTLANVSINSAVFKTFTVENNINAGTRQVKLAFTNHFEDRQLIVDWLHVQFIGATETQPPIISNVTATNFTSSSAHITWSTDEPADSQVEYGLTTSYGSSSLPDPALVTSHTVTLSGLQPNTTYHYRVKSKDAAGNLSTSGDFTFTTLPVDVTPPEITKVAANNISASTATINWNTNEAGDSQVEYGLTTSYGSSSSLDAALVTSHSVTLSNLQPNTTYHYRVKSKDAAGNLATSNDFTFTTGFTTTLFADDFNAATIDTNKWNKGTNAGNQSLVASSRLELRSQGSETGWVITRHAYAAKNTIVSVKVVQPNNDGDLGISPTFNLASKYGVYDQPNWYRFYVYRNSNSGPYRLFVQWKKSSVEDGLDVTGSLVINGAVYLRLRFDETNIHFEASLDGVNWTDTYTEAFGLPGYTLDSNFYYELAAYNTPAKGVLTVDDFAIMNTSSTQDTQPPQISGVATQNITNVNAQIIWQTNEASDSQVEYGLTASYGSSSPLDPALVNSHSVTLANLQPNTTYHYRVKSKDAAGNLSTSGDFTFTTLPADVTPPEITNVAANNISASTATINWNTNEASDSQVEYGLTTGYGSSSPLDATLVTSHSVTLSNLQPNTTYHYRVKSKDAAGNLATSNDFTFTTGFTTTLFADDFNAATIDTNKWNKGTNAGNQSLVASSRLELRSQGSETGWVITRHAYAAKNTIVSVKVVQPNNDGDLGISPTFNLASKYGVYDQPNWYRFYVYRSGNSGPYRLFVQWKKSSVEDGLDVTGSLVINGAVYLRLRFDETNIHFEASLDGVNWTDTYTEAFGLPGHTLDSNFYYELAAYNTSSKGVLAVDDFAINTSASTPDTQPPQISGVAAQNITTTGAQIVWQTNEASDSQVEYGLTASYGSSSPLDPALVNSHSVTLANLQPNTTYHYRVKSKDAAGNLSTSGDFTFTTLPADVTPPEITNVAANNISASTATINWNTNEASDSQVEYGLTTSYGSSS
ncbi:MAG: fibronectin type III domain-containing protein [candidate division KSB1 bacterium]|nr:fibronectin type III domain-containing protein [candidate division KSB1 bacterium]